MNHPEQLTTPGDAVPNTGEEKTVLRRSKRIAEREAAKKAELASVKNNSDVPKQPKRRINTTARMTCGGIAPRLVPPKKKNTPKNGEGRKEKSKE